MFVETHNNFGQVLLGSVIVFRTALVRKRKCFCVNSSVDKFRCSDDFVGSAMWLQFYCIECHFVTRRARDQLPKYQRGLVVARFEDLVAGCDCLVAGCDGFGRRMRLFLLVWQLASQFGILHPVPVHPESEERSIVLCTALVRFWYDGH